MAEIYKITNMINGKIYIGKTERTSKERFWEHTCESRCDRSQHRPLYRAIKKYGINNFKVETLEIVDKNAEEREVYYIKKYDTFNNKKGYNATAGGEGKPWLNEKEILECYKKEQNMQKVAEIMNCHSCSVKRILVDNNIEIKLFPMQKQLYCKNKETYKVFESIQDAIDWILINKLSSSKNRETIKGSIGRALNGRRNSYLGMEWQYVRG